MLNLIGTILIGVSLAVILVVVVGSAPLGPRGRLVLAAAFGAWAALAGAVAGAGALTNPLTVLALFGTPIVLAVALAIGSSTARRVFGAIPLQTLIGLNVVRLGGVLFVLLAADGRLAGPFPHIAGWGDFLTGAFAIPMGLAVAGAGVRDRALLAWNGFGMLDLIVAVSLGLISRNGSPLQLIHAGVGTAAMQTLPWAFIPTVLVPFFLIAHAAIFARVLSRGRGRWAGPAMRVRSA